MGNLGLVMVKEVEVQWLNERFQQFDVVHPVYQNRALLPR